jgi:hypothetical protein
MSRWVDFTDSMSTLDISSVNPVAEQNFSLTRDRGEEKIDALGKVGVLFYSYSEVIQ